MAIRASGCIWLVAGLFFGLVSLVLMGGGIYFVINAHLSVEKHEKAVEKETQEISRLKARPENFGQVKLANERLEAATVEQKNAERERLIYMIVSGASLIPALMTLAFLAMSALKFMQKPKTESAEEEDEENEKEEEDEDAEVPPVKKKPEAKPKPADDED